MHAMELSCKEHIGHPLERKSLKSPVSPGITQIHIQHFIVVLKVKHAFYRHVTQGS